MTKPHLLRYARLLLAVFALLAGSAARAQMGLGEAGLAIATVQWVLLVLAVLVPLAIIALVLYGVLRLLRPKKPHTSFLRCLGYAMLTAVVVGLGVLGWEDHQRVQAARSAKAGCQEVKKVPPETLFSTALEPSGPCQLKPCVKTRFVAPGGSPLRNVPYVVKNASGEELSVGTTDKDGNVIWFGSAVGEVVGFDLHWPRYCALGGRSVQG